MELIETTRPDFTFVDDRGSLTQLVHDGFNQINVLITNQGVVRGAHYHKLSTEAFYIVTGLVEVTAIYNDKEKKYVFHDGDFFIIRPFVYHSMFFLEKCTMVQMYDKCVELGDSKKDIYYE